MCSRPQFTDLTYMGGTGLCLPMTINFGTVIQSQYTSLNIKFGVNRTFHVPKSLVYRFDLYGRHRTLLTDQNNFWQSYLELVPCLSMYPRSRYTGLVSMGGIRSCGPMQPIFHSYRHMASRRTFAKFEVHSSLRSDAIVITTDGRTDGQTDIAQKFQYFELIK